MSKVRIAVSPPTEQLPQIRPAPREGLTRWQSQYEDKSPRDRVGIFMTRSAYRSIDRHVSHARNRAVEVGGMLIGHAYRSPAGGLYTVVEGNLEATHVQHGPLHLTFTSDTLADLLNRLEDSYPDKEIVGWYHTHPGLSVFLSSMDTWLHTHIFPKPWHVALVVDPQANHGGFFSYAAARAADHPESLDPHRYCGFYEINEDRSDTTGLVVWRNLEPNPATLEGILWEPGKVVED